MGKCSILLAGVVAFAATAGNAAVYSYVYAGPTGSGTAGAFTVSGSPGAYALTSFFGTVGGAFYQTADVAFKYKAPDAISFGGALNGAAGFVVNPFSSANDFIESRSFTPGAVSFTDAFLYLTSGSSPGLDNISATLLPSDSYTYVYQGAAGGGTAGTFTVSGSPGAYALTSFFGTVGGAYYQTADVAFQYKAPDAISFGGALNGAGGFVVNPFSNANDFIESRSFTPGVATFTDAFLYLTPGSFPGLDEVSATLLSAPVPEPASWAMFIGGFGLVGAAMRRKQVAVTFA